eukprot:Clim_evm18s33 gene=Clim_evmTU18s33
MVDPQRDSGDMPVSDQKDEGSQPSTSEGPEHARKSDTNYIDQDDGSSSADDISYEEVETSKQKKMKFRESLDQANKKTAYAFEVAGKKTRDSWAGFKDWQRKEAKKFDGRMEDPSVRNLSSLAKMNAYNLDVHYKAFDDFRIYDPHAAYVRKSMEKEWKKYLKNIHVIGGWRSWKIVRGFNWLRFRIMRWYLTRSQAVRKLIYLSTLSIGLWIMFLLLWIFNHISADTAIIVGFFAFLSIFYLVIYLLVAVMKVYGPVRKLQRLFSDLFILPSSLMFSGILSLVLVEALYSNRTKYPNALSDRSENIYTNTAASIITVAVIQILKELTSVSLTVNLYNSTFYRQRLVRVATLAKMAEIMSIPRADMDDRLRKMLRAHEAREQRKRQKSDSEVEKIVEATKAGPGMRASMPPGAPMPSILEEDPDTRQPSQPTSPSARPDSLPRHTTGALNVGVRERAAEMLNVEEDPSSCDTDDSDDEQETRADGKKITGSLRVLRSTKSANEHPRLSTFGRTVGQYMVYRNGDDPLLNGEEADVEAAAGGAAVAGAVPASVPLDLTLQDPNQRTVSLMVGSQTHNEGGTREFGVIPVPVVVNPGSVGEKKSKEGRDITLPVTTGLRTSRPNVEEVRQLYPDELTEEELLGYVPAAFKLMRGARDPRWNIEDIGSGSIELMDIVYDLRRAWITGEDNLTNESLHDFASRLAKLQFANATGYLHRADNSKGWPTELEHVKLMPAHMAHFLEPGSVWYLFSMLNNTTAGSKAQSSVSVDSTAGFTFSEWRALIAEWIMERKGTQESILSSDSLTKTMSTFLNSVSGFFCFVAILIIVGVDPAPMFVALSALVVTYAFIFGNTLKDYFEGVVFVLGIHPYDIGDRLQIDGTMYFVQEINLLTTTMRRTRGDIIYYRNSQLQSKIVTNLRRSNNMAEEIDFYIAGDTTEDDIAKIRREVANFCAEETLDWKTGPLVYVTGFDTKTNQICMNFWFTSKHNWQAWKPKAERAERMMLFLRNLCKKMGIRAAGTAQMVSLLDSRSQGAMVIGGPRGKPSYPTPNFAGVPTDSMG